MIEEKIEKTIEESLDGLPEIGTEGREKEVKVISTLSDSLVKIKDAKLRDEAAQHEYNKYLECASQDRLFAYVDRGVDAAFRVAEITVPLWFYDKMCHIFLKFEKDGIVSSMVFRNFIGNIGKMRFFK